MCVCVLRGKRSRKLNIISAYDRRRSVTRHVMYDNRQMDTHTVLIHTLSLSPRPVLSFSFSLSIRRVTASVYSQHVSNMSDTLHLIFHSFILCSLVSLSLSIYLGEVKKRTSRSEERQKRHVVDVVVVLFCSFRPLTMN